jgi:HAD superfamily hydrolase (TIGR01509 family)
MIKTLLVDAAGTFVIEGEGIYQPLHNLLETYQNPKLIVTNANDEQMIEYGLVNLPYEMFTLQHDPDKTDPEYFKKLLSTYNLKPEDVIYFEHNEEAVKSAQSVGIVSHFYDANKKDIVALKLFLDANLK